ncbi:DUF4292 domain-containing protein [Cesiribacter sp. SM1]|uniref:DUF4292 domain-containing protein n=1 Tax=Cesiribacter sp. SM1 TaxID=2861196 RepID=UPI001CD5C480|nr:DUF4292 domain-containing protein [Cesiribacter sp. SM1]
MNKNLLVLLLSALILVVGCKRDTIPSVSESDLKGLNIRPADFKYFSSRSKINFDDGNNRIGATANIRIAKDSLIWISITPGFGIEAARGLVTRDSLFLVNKLQKEYHAYSFKELSQKLNVVVDYDILQSALLGDPIKPITNNKGVMRNETETIVMQQEQGIDIINYFSNNTLKLTKVLLQEPSSPNNLMLEYADFQEVANNILPFTSTITAQYQDNQQMKATVVAFQHNKAEFSDTALPFPFSIPDRYVRKQ